MNWPRELAPNRKSICDDIRPSRCNQIELILYIWPGRRLAREIAAQIELHVSTFLQLELVIRLLLINNNNSSSRRLVVLYREQSIELDRANNLAA